MLANRYLQQRKRKNVCKCKQSTIRNQDARYHKHKPRALHAKHKMQSTQLLPFILQHPSSSTPLAPSKHTPTTPSQPIR